MSIVLSSDLHLDHKLISVSRGFFDDIPQIANYKKYNPDVFDVRPRVNILNDLVTSGKISKDEVFRRISLMTEKVIANHNSKVGPKDDVYLLGDMYFGNDVSIFESYLARMNGARFYLIKGNHDNSKMFKLNCWEGVYERYRLDNNNKTFYLDHYPMATWNKAHRGSYNLHGHCHGSYPISSQQMDVGLDTNDLFPYFLHECVEKMAKAPKFVIPDYHGSAD